DPRMGNRRRVLVEDQLRRLSRRTVEGVNEMLSEVLIQAKSFLETGHTPPNAVCHGRRAAQHAAAGSSKEVTSSVTRSEKLHGPAAPTDDVLRPGIRETGHPSTWPKSSNWLPEPVEPAGHFPPAA